MARRADDPRQGAFPFRSVLGGSRNEPGYQYVDCGQCVVLRRTMRSIKVGYHDFNLSPGFIPLKSMSRECELRWHNRGILEIELWLAQKLKLYVGKYPNRELRRE